LLLVVATMTFGILLIAMLHLLFASSTSNFIMIIALQSQRRHRV
jgi:hypothetical protein